ncbi:MAG: HD domain-containing protein, partial [Chloroflexi bacterium]|nr:HD domain-containing protein [Chloroflexota bacterium]
RLHDIGKIATPDRILQKPGPLDHHERDEMHRHSEAGYELLRRMGDFWDGAQLVRWHHERPDGRGYPRGLRGTELPLEASVISVCDAYDAMTSDRVYREALTSDRVMSELLAGRGTQWHAAVVDALIEMVREEREAGRPSLAMTVGSLPRA